METMLPTKIERNPETHEPVSGNAGTAMKITNDTINSALHSSQSDSLAQKGMTAPPAENSRTRTGDRVELSENSREVEKLTAAVAAMPPANSEKIESIQKRIAEGTYAVSGMAVAEKMLGAMGIAVPGEKD